MKHKLEIPAAYTPRVLFLGNGILRLAGGGNWSDLLREIETPPHRERNLKAVPFAMQPEAVCGVDVEDVQRRTATVIKEISTDEHGILKKLLSLPFDAILTTNYTYEIENVLSGREWTESARRKAFMALYGSSHVRHNTYMCSIVSCPDGRNIPVFHVHGERMRKHSLVLSYYSYANSVSRLTALNKMRGNDYQEKQLSGGTIDVLSWLDYFLLGEVYAVGYVFDTSEFDIWWAIERKARENAKHGALHAFMIETEEGMEEKPHKVLFEAMGITLHHYKPDTGYHKAYEAIVECLQKSLNDSNSQ